MLAQGAAELKKRKADAMGAQTSTQLAAEEANEAYLPYPLDLGLNEILKLVEEAIVRLIDKQVIRKYPDKLDIKETGVYRVLNGNGEHRAAATWRAHGADKYWNSMLKRANSFGALYYNKPTCPRSDFNQQLLERVAEICRTKTVVITGPAGLAKSAFALHLFPRTIVASSCRELKRLDASHGCLVIDNWNLEGKKAEVKQNILTYDREATITDAFTSAHIPANMPRVIVSNKEGIRALFSDKQLEKHECCEEEDDQTVLACMRRVHFVDLWPHWGGGKGKGRSRPRTLLAKRSVPDVESAAGAPPAQ
jgi:hypothetical protein